MLYIIIDQTNATGVEVKSGSNITLSCPTENALTVDILYVYWKRVTRENETEFPGYISEGSLTHPGLRIEYIHKSDAGTYVCHSNATTGLRTYEYEITVNEGMVFFKEK